MEIFQWSPLFKTGLEEVDLQHQRLVELLNQLAQDADSAQPSYIDAALNDLAQYAIHHFGCEERIMSVTHVDSRHADAHRLAHERFIQQVGGWMKQRQSNQSLSLWQLLDFLASWLTFHILGEDQALGRQVQAIQSGLSPDDACERDRVSDDPRTDILLGAMHRLYAGLVNRNEELLASQQQLSTLNATLEQRVAERTAALVEANRCLREEQQRSIEAEKMASLGRMVAGFAHEVNTPIGIAVASASQMREMVGEIGGLLEQDEVTEEDFRSRLTILDEAADLALTNLNRAADMVRSFKRTAVDQSSDAERDYLLSEIIEDVMKGLLNSFKMTRIRIDVNCPDDLSLYGPAGSVAQLLTNLLLNSRMHGFDDGRATGIIHIGAQADAETVQIDYRDDGIGMDAETVQQIFEPFFTTRRGTGGSGLGMYIAYNIVTQALGGTIQCDSIPGQGTHFQIRYPRCRAEKKDSES